MKKDPKDTLFYNYWKKNLLLVAKFQKKLLSLQRIIHFSSRVNS